MRVIALKTLKDFWELHPDSKIGLQEWLKKIKTNEYKSPAEITNEHKTADYVGNSRIVFNIAKNKYRLIAAFRYDKQICWIVFVGTHSEYDKIDAKTIKFNR